MSRLLLLALAAAALAGAAAATELRTEDEKTLYALGVALSRNLGPLQLSPAEFDVVVSGLRDGTLGRPRLVNADQYMVRVHELMKTRMQAAAEAEKTAGRAFLDTAAAERGAVRTPSGMVYQEIVSGSGPKPGATDTVRVHYTGTLIDGTVFDSSVQRGEPASFPLDGVIRCWTEGLQRMAVGGKARLVCPAELAYGDRGAPPAIRPGATLVFDVELLDVVRAAPGATPTSDGSPRR